MEVLQRDPECSRPEACSVLESVNAAAAGKPLSCPNHEGKVGTKLLVLYEVVISGYAKMNSMIYCIFLERTSLG